MRLLPIAEIKCFNNYARNVSSKVGLANEYDHSPVKIIPFNHLNCNHCAFSISISLTKGNSFQYENWNKNYAHKGQMNFIS